MNALEKRHCGQLNYDIRQHVDWMTRYSDEAWRDLDKRVRDMEPKVKNHHEGIAFSELQLIFLKKFLSEFEQRSNSEIEELQRNFIQLNDKYEKIHGNCRDIKQDVHLMKQDIIRIQDKSQNIKVGTEGIKALNDKFSSIQGQIKLWSEKMQINTQAIKSQRTQMKENCRILKNDITSTANHLKSRLQKEITQLEGKNQEQIKKYKIENTRESNGIKEAIKKIKEEFQQSNNIKQHEKEKISLLLSSEIIGNILKEERRKEEQKKQEEQKQKRMKNILKKMRQTPEKIVDKTCARANSFQLSNKNITMIKQKVHMQQLLLDVVMERMLTFSVRIVKSTQNWIAVGVVNREKQQEAMYSGDSGNAVSYWGETGRIYYGEGGKCREKETGDTFKEGMEVKVKMEGNIVTFGLSYGGSTNVHVIRSSILSHPESQFVPFIEMYHAGDCVEWNLQ